MQLTNVKTLRQIVAGLVRLPSRFNRDQRGTISIISVFAVMLLTILLGMVMNVGRQVDGKIRMQNAADAATYSGGVVLSRGMNTLTFTNHLLCDVFALTAYMREGRDRNAESYVPPILGAWENTGRTFSTSGFAKFDRLGSAILQKVPLEQNLVTTYGDWAATVSTMVLPLMETILAEELIPEYQRSVVEAFPDIAQMAVMEVARRNGEPDFGRGEMLGAFWRSSGELVGGYGEAADPTLPVVDPVLGAVPNRQEYARRARRQRSSLAHRYLADWNRQAMTIFDRKAKMCQYGRLWRSFTCGQLEHLLRVEYPDSNLPYQIRTKLSEVADPTGHMEEEFTFVGVVYWRKLPEMMPGLFRNPAAGDSIAYAEVRMFIPRQRLVWSRYGRGGGATSIPIGGVPGDFPDWNVGGGNDPDPDPRQGRWRVVRQGLPVHWDLLNQRWACQLVPATTPKLAEILQTPPALPEFGGSDIELPNLGNLTTEEIVLISPH